MVQKKLKNSRKSPFQDTSQDSAEYFTSLCVKLTKNLKILLNNILCLFSLEETTKIASRPAETTTEAETTTAGAWWIILFFVIRYLTLPFLPHPEATQCPPCITSGSIVDWVALLAQCDNPGRKWSQHSSRSQCKPIFLQLVEPAHRDKKYSKRTSHCWDGNVAATTINAMQLPQPLKQLQQ